MSIATLDQYIASAKQRIRIVKTGGRTTVAALPFSVFEVAGDPGGGTLAGSSTSAGVVPTDATAGCPLINFSSGTGYLTKVEFASTVASRLALFDMVWKAGAYLWTSATTTLSAQPDISGRCPDYTGGASFGSGVEIWVEFVAALTNASANFTVNVTYTNQSGTTGRTGIATAGLNTAAGTVGRMYQIGLQAGDTGVQKIETVIVTVGAATAGSFNILLLRPLWTAGRVKIAGDGDIHDMLKTGMPIVYQDSAIILQAVCDSTALGVPELVIEIASA